MANSDDSKPGQVRRFAVLLPEEGSYGEIALNIARAIKQQGVDCVYISIPGLSYDRLNCLDKDELYEVLVQREITDVFTMNIGRQQLKIPEGVQIHTWVMDLYYTSCGIGRQSDRTWMACYYWKHRYGQGEYLPPVTDYGRYLDEPDGYDADVSFVGCLPSLMIRITEDAELDRKCKDVIEAIRDHLDETNCFIADWGVSSALVYWAQLQTGHLLSKDLQDHLIHHVICRLVRRVQRERLMDRLVEICTGRGWSLRIAGENWDMSPKFKPYCVGYVPPGAELARFCRRSRINVHTNGDSNIHVHVLECLASGSFVLAEEHMTDESDFGVRSVLNEDQLPTFSVVEDLDEKLAYYLANEPARKRAIEEGGRVVREKFNYQMLAEKLLGERQVENVDRKKVCQTGV